MQPIDAKKVNHIFDIVHLKHKNKVQSWLSISVGLKMCDHQQQNLLHASSF